MSTQAVSVSAEGRQMLNKDQSQDVGGGATAIQAGGSVTVVNVGVTASEARQIALDVAKATFYELTGAAKETASIRVEEITEQVIKKLETDYPEGLQKAKDPDFQYALYTVQKEYARNGDKDLGDLLVDLLVASRTIIWPLVKQIRPLQVPLLHGLHRRLAAQC